MKKNKSKENPNNYVLVVGLEEYNINYNIGIAKIKEIAKEVGIDNFKAEKKQLYFYKVFEEFKDKFQTKFISVKEYEKTYKTELMQEIYCVPSIYFVINHKVNFSFINCHTENLLRKECNYFASKILKDSYRYEEK